MATTTPNFGWPVPTSTDLVKDGATAIEALGDGIDTSMVDLKGGTTGQLLAKASNTDMDFTWTSPNPGDITAVAAGIGISGGGTSGDVTITNSMATAIDAKGDLIPGTGADTFARLAVGSDFAFLQADSAQSTGLVWNNAAWTSYTPTVTATSGTFTTVSASGKYTRIGKFCTVQFRVTITNNGTAAGQVVVSAPFTSNNSFGTNFIGNGREVAVAGFTMTPRMISNTSDFYLTKIDATYPGGTGFVLDNTVTYEVA